MFQKVQDEYIVLIMYTFQRVIDEHIVLNRNNVLKNLKPEIPYIDGNTF